MHRGGQREERGNRGRRARSVHGGQGEKRRHRRGPGGREGCRHLAVCHGGQLLSLSRHSLCTPADLTPLNTSERIPYVVIVFKTSPECSFSLVSLAVSFLYCLGLSASVLLLANCIKGARTVNNNQ